MRTDDGWERRRSTTRGAMANENGEQTDSKLTSRANATPGESYPGVPGATRAEVDAFLEDLDSFQPIVRASEANGRLVNDDDGR